MTDRDASIRNFLLRELQEEDCDFDDFLSNQLSSQRAELPLMEIKTITLNCGMKLTSISRSPYSYSKKIIS